MDLIELATVIGWSGRHAGGLATDGRGARVAAKGFVAAVSSGDKERLIGGHDGDVSAVACSGSLIATGQQAAASSAVSGERAGPRPPAAVTATVSSRSLTRSIHW